MDSVTPKLKSYRQCQNVIQWELFVFMEPNLAGELQLVWVGEAGPCWVARASLDWFCSPGQSQTHSYLPTCKSMNWDHGCVIKPELRKDLIEI